MAKSYIELDVWMQGRKLVSEVYALTKSFPREEQFGLTSQLRRAAVSVPSNIAEGCGRNHYKDSIQFFFHARGSLYEIETQTLLSVDLGFVGKSAADSILERVESCKKLLNGFINYFERLASDGTVNDPLAGYTSSHQGYL